MKRLPVYKLSSQVAIRALMVCFVGFVGCSTEKDGGPINMQLIQAAPGHCMYNITPTMVETLDSLEHMRGRVGQVVTTHEEVTSRPEILEEGDGFEPLDTRFFISGGTAYPQDYKSLFAGTLYKTLEQVYLMFARLDPSSDLNALVPDLSDTRIVYQARYLLDEESGEEYRDNAAFTAIGSKNYLFSFPIEEVTDIPLGLNPFIVAHESTHFVNRYVWKKHLDLSDTTTKNVAGSLDEGTADYGGFMVTGDPGGFLCSFPTEKRDMAVPKTIASVGDVSSTRYPIHAGGAVWAYAQYEIGQRIGHEVNMKALIRAFSGCVKNSGTLTFQKAIQCHTSALGSNASAAQQVYSQTFGSGS